MNLKDIRTVWREVSDELMRRRSSEGYWRGRLCSSPLATATATSAIAVYCESLQNTKHCLIPHLEHAVQLGVRYLLTTQRPDGGWGDTDRSLSNIATTYLVRAALELFGNRSPTEEAIKKADAYIDHHGGEKALRQRYGHDQTFVAPILTNVALAQLCSWEAVPQLPFELAVFPQSLYRFLRLPVVSYAIPALVAIGLARYHHGPRSNRVLSWLRSLIEEKSLSVVERMQPDSGGFLEAVPLTAFVTMSLSSIGLPQHPVVQKAIRFLTSLQREDGSWPVDVDLATWVTTLAANALATSGTADWQSAVSFDWILNCQHLDVHPFTGAAPGGWGWTDHSGSVPDADDTSGALLALSHFWRTGDKQTRLRILPSVLLGIDWLVNLQNRDGGWPTFCRGWGRLPFDRSAVDLTAHAVRALYSWQTLLRSVVGEEFLSEMLTCANRWPDAAARRLRRLLGIYQSVLNRTDTAVKKGMRFLCRNQRSEGYWLPLWFGNERLPNEENAVYGTSRCLLAYVDLNRMDDPPAIRAVNWLVRTQNQDGSWGRSACDREQRQHEDHESHQADSAGSVEETSLALSALANFGSVPNVTQAIKSGLTWLTTTINAGGLDRATPIGLYFARLWYYEELYPIVFSLEALARCLRLHNERQ